jgi:hypothetical protein
VSWVDVLVGREDEEQGKRKRNKCSQIWDNWQENGTRKRVRSAENKVPYMKLKDLEGGIGVGAEGMSLLYRYKRSMEDDGLRNSLGTPHRIASV